MPLSPVITLRVPNDLLQKLKARAAKEGRPVSNLIKYIVLQYLSTTQVGSQIKKRKE